MIENMDQNLKKNIVVTGFGPFNNHPVNASWEAVNHLSKIKSEILTKLYNVNLIVKEIPVVYDDVIQSIPEIWKQYNPLFVIHVGVSHLAKCFQIESQACSSGYMGKDVQGMCPKTTNDVCQTLQTVLDLDKLCKDLRDEHNYVACVSNNAGRYLCEFTFYQSLNVNQNRTLFIHVPDFNVYPTDVTAQGLFHVICWLLDNHKRS